ncbi:MAG: hypothetical protein JNL63_09105 [Bacteroidia bacterium]|nr:hypothetical protein [Bacteroidia bacterium]
MKAGILASGYLGLVCIKDLYHDHDLVFICTDKNSTEIIKYANTNNIPIFIGNPRNGNVSGFIYDKVIDILISVNYLYLIENDLIRLPLKMAFNIHGALLPKYRGRAPHIWAIINNENVTGISAHLITAECDSGDIIEQVTIPIGPDDTGYNLIEKFARRYPLLIKKIISKIKRGTVKPVRQDITKISFFGKRVPEDGLINWSWQKERLYNWVRALSAPYPGAFTYYNKTKIIIHASRLSDLGYIYDMENGLILKVGKNSLFVKTTNGVIELYKIENFKAHSFKSGKILSNEC